MGCKSKVIDLLKSDIHLNVVQPFSDQLLVEPVDSLLDINTQPDAVLCFHELFSQSSASILIDSLLSLGSESYPIFVVSIGQFSQESEMRICLESITRSFKFKYFKFNCWDEFSFGV